MPIENALFHKCDVYHAELEASTPLYGVPQKSEIKYPDLPDLTDVRSYWELQTNDIPNINSAEPDRMITKTYKVFFLSSEDIRLNDKVVYEGNEYELMIPNELKTNKRSYVWEVIAESLERA